MVTAQLADNSFTYWKYGDNKEGLPYAEFIRQYFKSDDSNWPMRVDGTNPNYYSSATIYVSPPGGSQAIKEIRVSVKFTDNSSDPEISKDISEDQNLSTLYTIVADDTRSTASIVPAFWK